MKTVFLLDNKDSFTYNLVHYLESHDVQVVVVRNDASPSEWPEHPDAVVLSPGPGIPRESGTLMQAIDTFWGNVPILGVCLGHQALVEYSGGSLYQMEHVDHGISKTASIDINNPLFLGLSERSEVGLYHSWAVHHENIENSWNVIANSGTIILGVHHLSEPIWGVQFHPESIMTPQGKKMIGNFIKFIEK